MTAAYRKVVTLRKAHTRAQLAAALKCSISAVDGVLRNKAASDEMDARIKSLAPPRFPASPT